MSEGFHSQENGPRAAPAHYPAPTPYGQPGGGGGASNGKATAGLVLGIISILVNTFFVPAILAIVFSSLGIKRAGELERQGMAPVGRGAAIAGLVTGIVGVLHSLTWKWLILFLL